VAYPRKFGAAAAAGSSRRLPRPSRSTNATKHHVERLVGPPLLRLSATAARTIG